MGRMTGSTRILVTHQRQYLPDCDRIVVLRDGCIAAQGTYAELCAAGVPEVVPVDEAGGEGGGEGQKGMPKTFSQITMDDLGDPDALPAPAADGAGAPPVRAFSSAGDLAERKGLLNSVSRLDLEATSVQQPPGDLSEGPVASKMRHELSRYMRPRKGSLLEPALEEPGSTGPGSDIDGEQGAGTAEVFSPSPSRSTLQGTNGKSAALLRLELARASEIGWPAAAAAASHDQKGGKAAAAAAPFEDAAKGDGKPAVPAANAGQLVAKEGRASGGVSLRVYGEYMLQMGQASSVFVIVCMLIGQASPSEGDALQCGACRCAFHQKCWPGTEAPVTRPGPPDADKSDASMAPTSAALNCPQAAEMNHTIWLSKWARSSPATQEQHIWILVYGMLTVAVVVLAVLRSVVSQGSSIVLCRLLVCAIDSLMFLGAASRFSSRRRLPLRPTSTTR